MQARKQFHVSAQRRSFFDRKVLKYGYSRTIALGKVIPKDWQYVRITILTKDKSHISLDLTKLTAVESLAQSPKTDTRDREDT